MTPHVKTTPRYVLDFSKGDLQGLKNHFHMLNSFRALLVMTLPTPDNYSSQVLSIRVPTLYPRLNSKPTNLPGGARTSNYLSKFSDAQPSLFKTIIIYLNYRDRLIFRKLLPLSLWLEHMESHFL